MSFLLDTNVVSELQRPHCDPEVDRRIGLIPDHDLMTSAIVFGELSKGIASLPKGKKRSALEAWLRHFEGEFQDKILPFDTAAADVWGSTIADAAQRGFQLQAIDSQIAATAICHDLVVITRNVSDFAPTGVPLWNPWEADYSPAN